MAERRRRPWGNFTGVPLVNAVGGVEGVTKVPQRPGGASAGRRSLRSSVRPASAAASTAAGRPGSAWSRASDGGRKGGEVDFVRRQRVARSARAARRVKGLATGAHGDRLRPDTGRAAVPFLDIEGAVHGNAGTASPGRGDPVDTTAPPRHEYGDAAAWRDRLMAERPVSARMDRVCNSVLRKMRPATARAKLIGGHGVDGVVHPAADAPVGTGVVMAAADLTMSEPIDWNVLITEAAVREDQEVPDEGDLVAKWAVEIRPLNMRPPAGAMNAESFNWQAFRKRSRGDFAGAIRLYDRALSLHPRNFTAMFNRGFAYLRCGETTRALKDFRKARDLNPRNVFAHHNCGVCLLLMKRYDEAAKCITLAMQDGRVERGFLQARALAYRKTGQFDLAIRDYIAERQLSRRGSSVLNSMPQKRESPKKVRPTISAGDSVSAYKQRHSPALSPASRKNPRLSPSTQLRFDNVVADDTGDLSGPADAEEEALVPVRDALAAALRAAGVHEDDEAGHDKTAMASIDHRENRAHTTPVRRSPRSNTPRSHRAAHATRRRGQDPIEADPSKFYADGQLYEPAHFKPLPIMQSSDELLEQCRRIMSRRPGDRTPSDLRFLEVLTRHTRFFAELSRAAHLRLCRVMTMVEYPVDTMICKQRQPARFFAVVLAGSISVYMNKLPSAYSTVKSSMAVSAARNQLMKLKSKKSMRFQKLQITKSQSKQDAAVAAEKAVEKTEVRARRALTARDEVAASAQSRGSQYDATDPNSLGELIGNLFVGQSFGKTALEEQAKLGDVSIVADDQVALIQIHREDFLAEMAHPGNFEFLLACPLFAGCPPAEIEELAAHVQEKRLLSGQDIVKQGAPLRGIYLIKHGRATVYRMVTEDTLAPTSPTSSRPASPSPKRMPKPPSRPEKPTSPLAADDDGEFLQATFDVPEAASLDDMMSHFSDDSVTRSVQSDWQSVGSTLSVAQRRLQELERETHASFSTAVAAAKAGSPRAQAQRDLRRAHHSGAIDMHTAELTPLELVALGIRSVAGSDSEESLRLRKLELGELRVGDYYGAEEAVLHWSGEASPSNVPMETLELSKRSAAAAHRVMQGGQWSLEQQSRLLQDGGSGFTYQWADLQMPKRAGLDTDRDPRPTVRPSSVGTMTGVSSVASRAAVTTDTNVDLVLISKDAVFKHTSFETRQRMRENARKGKLLSGVRSTREKVKWQHERARIVAEHVHFPQRAESS